MSKSNPIKQAMIKEVAEQLLEYYEKKDKLDVIRENKEYRYWQAHIEATYNLAKRFDIWNFEIHEYIKNNIVSKCTEEEIKKNHYLGYFIDEII